ncbi:kinase-like domain-containing protein [Leptodontidium sp. 2 PMI_412]|nr:kinase-like domain-containing protein [Leptodontidium sp. 2 PMI_412]
MNSDSSHVIEIDLYYPENVNDVLGMGSSCFIGLVNDTTVMKYPYHPNDKQNLPAIGDHDRIIRLKGRTGAGLLLEYACHGSLGRYLSSHNPTIQQRITWATQAAEAIALVHEKGVIHCDISVNNLLLDAELNIKLCDFQGRLLRPDRSVKLVGLSSENVKASMPRADPNHADEKTDIFALGTVFYQIIEGCEPFQELDSFTQEEEIEERFVSGQFPTVRYAPMTAVIHKCWRGEYNSTHGVISDLELRKSRESS